MTDKQLLILELLLNANSELYGLDLINLSNNKLKRGTIYIDLQSLEEKELINSRVKVITEFYHNDGKTEVYSGKLERKVYKITENGRQFLHQKHLEQMSNASSCMAFNAQQISIEGKLIWNEPKTQGWFCLLPLKD